MKIVTVCVLGWAVMALVGAAEEKAKNDQTESSDLVKRYPWRHSGSTVVNGRRFYYVNRLMTWAQAEKNCQVIGANLASVVSMEEYHRIQMLTAPYGDKETWIGGTDAQTENTWFWSNGRPFRFSNWCPHEPNNSQARQHCIQMNHGDKKCWDDAECWARRPSVCVKKIRSCQG